MKPGKSNRKAFTLVEILIVICVISVLFVVLVSRVDFATDKARQAGVQNDMHAIQYAIHQVALEKGELVDDLNLLASLLNENLDTELMVRVEGNMLKTHATDPWGNEYQLRYNKGINNKGQLQVFSAGPDSDYSTNDDTVIAIVCLSSASGTNVVVKEDLSINEIIREDGTLPNQPVAPEHVCSFSRRVQSETFLKTAGNCKTEAIYFYSCECGAVGTATFTGSKNPSKHVDNPTIVYNSYNDEQHTKVTTCVGCNVVLDTTNINHTFNNNKCTDCNYERHVHSYTNQNPVEANKAMSATCSAAATYYYTCACGAKSDTTFVSGDALPHNYSGRVTTDPTCTTTGVRTYTCSTCSSSYHEVVEVTPHNYNKQIEDGYLASAATCKDYAKYYYSCVCGEPGTQTFNGTEFSSTHGDTETKYEYINESEHKVSSICKICNTSTQTITTGHGNLVNNKCSLCKGHVHSFTRQVENANTRVTEATCTKYATYKYSCADTTCNVLSDSSNTFEGSVYAAHIEENGKTENIHTKCSICGTTISSTHSYGTPVITKAATCTTTGTQEKTCTCGYVKTESVTALGHDIVSHSAKAATCTSVGWNAYETCNRCTYSTYQEVAMKSHTSTDGGTQAVHEKCSVCGKTLSSKHSYTKTTTKVATCAETGLFTYTCKCGYKYTETIGKLSDHLTTTTTYKNFGLGVTGHITDTTCTICNKTVDSVEEAHVYNNDTCTKCGFVVSTISGEWIIKTTPSFDGMYRMIWEPVTFTSNNETYTSIRYGFDGGDGHFIAYMTDENSISAYNTYNNLWTNDAYRVVDFGETEQQVSKELHDWLIENATQQIYVLNGVHKFNTELNFGLNDNQISQSINFTSNKNSYNNMSVVAGGSLVILYNESDVCYYDVPSQTSMWMNDNYCVVDLGTEPQTVSSKFYNWFVKNTYEVVPISGTFVFNDTLQLPNQTITEEVKFSDKSSQYVGMLIETNMLTYVSDDEADSFTPYVEIGWFTYLAKTITFEDNQMVSVEFYDWIISNASPYVDENVTIPIGGTYITGIIYEDDGGEVEENSKNAVYYYEGEQFPTPTRGDKYIYNGYEYCYQVPRVEGAMFWDYYCGETNGWGCYYIGTSKTPGEILETIAGKPVTSLDATFTGKTLNIVPTIPSTIVTMDYAFSGATIDLSQVVIPNSVTILGAAFWQAHLSNTDGFVIPENVTDFEGLFNSATGLSGTIVINATATQFAHTGSFVNIDFSATNLTLTGTCSSIDLAGLEGINYCVDCNGTCYGHEKVAGIYTSGTNNLLFTWQELIDGGYIVVNNGVLTTPYDSSDAKNGARNILNGDLYLPDDGTIKELGNDAFHLCYNLTAVYLPDGLTSIGWMAFAGTKIQNINLPQSITKVETSAFYGCNNLTTIYYEGTMWNLYDIEWVDNWDANMPEIIIVCDDTTVSNHSIVVGGYGMLNYDFDLDMTWEEWINSDYNDGQYIIYNNEIYTYDKRYKLRDTSGNVSKTDKIKSLRKYFAIDTNPGITHGGGSN